jgi:hypothetical protein
MVSSYSVIHRRLQYKVGHLLRNKEGAKNGRLRDRILAWDGDDGDHRSAAPATAELLLILAIAQAKAFTEVRPGKKRSRGSELWTGSLKLRGYAALISTITAARQSYLGIVPSARR